VNHQCLGSGNDELVYTGNCMGSAKIHNIYQNKFQLHYVSPYTVTALVKQSVCVMSWTSLLLGPWA
jgi:hypothetical protein